MAKWVMGAMALLVTAGAAFGANYPVYEGTANNGLEDAELLIMYGGTSETDGLPLINIASVNASGQSYMLHVWSANQMEAIRGACAKSFEWEKTAAKNGVSVNKDLPFSISPVAVAWVGYNNKRHFSSFSINFGFYFGAKMKEYRLSIRSNEVKASDNEFLTISATIYLNKAQATAFCDALSEKNLNAAIKKVEQQDDLFK